MRKRLFKVETDFVHCGLRCVVLLMDAGHRCGYVGVSKDHNLYGQFYDNEEIECLSVHGGITYAGGGEDSKYPVESDLWWFGYDCGHYMDIPDYEAALAAFDDTESQIRLTSLKQIKDLYPGNGVVRTLEYCIEQCKQLAEQLKENVSEHK